MAEVTKPVVLDETAQAIVTALQAISTQITNNDVKVTISTTDIVDSQTPLPSGQLYMVIN